MPWEEKDVEGQGGAIEYDLAIATSKAGHTEYNEGKTALLILEGEKTFSNGRVMDDHVWVSAPAGWTTDAEGRFFVNEDDPDARFDKRAKIQQFITSAVKAGVPLQERTENSLDASGWAGLKIRIREEERSFKPRDGGDVVTYNQPLVIAYLGEVEGVNPKTTAAATPAAGATNGAGDDEQRAKATLIARKSADLVEHMDAVSRELKVPLDHEFCSQAFYESAKA